MSHHECAVGIVRTFLKKKGLESAVAELDAARQVPEDLSSSSGQAKALNMVKLLRVNKAREHQFKSIAEVLAAYYLPDDCRPGVKASAQVPAAEADGPGAAACQEPEAAASANTAAAVAPAPGSESGGVQGAISPEEAAQPPQAAAPVQPKPKAGPTFTAPDGKQFSDRNAFRKYVFQTFYTFTDKTGETLRKEPGEIEGQPFNLENLTDCTVLLLDHSEQIQVDDVTGSHVFIGPSCESVFLRDCSNCTFTVACKQLRTRDCHDCHVNLYSLTDPVVEASTGMVFAPYNGAYPGLDAHFKAAALDPRLNRFRSVFDFHKDDDSYRRPHFTVTEEAQPDWAVGDVPGGGEPVNPVPLLPPPPDDDEEGGASAGGGGVFMSFDIKTSAAEAEQRVEAALGGGAS